MSYAKIIGLGGHLPDNIISNKDLIEKKSLATTDEWIKNRTGICQRHIAPEGTLASDLALPASLQALEKAGIDSTALEMIIFATTTPDRIYPATACLLQRKLKIPPCPAFDVQAVCSGFLYALAVAEGFIMSGRFKNILVVGGEVYSHILDWEDRGTCVLFGDGAGAAVVTASDTPGIQNIKINADGSYADHLTVNAHLSNGKIDGYPYTKMNGSAVYRFAVEKMTEVTLEVLEGAQPDWLVLHQANERIIDAISQRLKIDSAKVIKTVSDQGNTSAASIPLALASNQEKFEKGDRIAIAAVGGGITWGAANIVW